MSRLPEAFIPPMGKISNRRFLARLNDWNCRVIKVSGEWTSVDVRETLVRVRSAHTHTGNSVDTFTEILGILGLDWIGFMSADLGPETYRKASESLRARLKLEEEYTAYMNHGTIPQWAMDEVQEQALSEHAKWQRKQDRRSLKEATSMAAQPVQPDPVIDLTNVDIHAELARVTKPEPDELPETPTRTRIINRVFDLLVESGEPMSTNRLCEALGDTSMSSTTGALLGLVRHGVAERVKPGVYRAVTDMMQQDTMRMNHQGKAQVTLSAPVVAPPTLVQAPQPVERERAVEYPPVSPTIVDDVLDLMFPDGMRVRAADLPLLDEWKRLTVEVIRRVGG